MAKSTEAVRLDYLMAASFYWYKAVGGDEQLVSALNRSRAAQLANELGEHTPTPQEVYTYAVGRWPLHKLHTETLGLPRAEDGLAGDPM